MLGLSGATTGAGVLSFPTHVGSGGLVLILLVLVLACLITFCCHRALTRLRLSGSNPSGNATEMVEEHFSKTGGMVITFPYSSATYPLLRIYGATVTNTFMTLWENQLGFVPLNHDFVALFLPLLMASVIWFSKDLMVKAMSYLVWSLTTSLVLVSLLPIPYWSLAVIDQVGLDSLSLTGHDGILITVWLGISIMIFSSSFSPVVLSLVASKREEYEKDFGRDFTGCKCSQTISRAGMLMVAVVMFFAFSCLFTLSPVSMVGARAQNIPVLSYLTNHFASITGTKTTFVIILKYATSTIASVVIFKSSLGHYPEALEGLNGLILKFGYKDDKTEVSLGKLNTINMIFIMDSTWVVIHINPNILDLIEVMSVPIIVSLLYLLPMYAIRKAPSLTKYHGRLDNVFIIIVGLLTVLNIVYKLF